MNEADKVWLFYFRCVWNWKDENRGAMKEKRKVWNKVEETRTEE